MNGKLPSSAVSLISLDNHAYSTLAVFPSTMDDMPKSMQLDLGGRSIIKFKVVRLSVTCAPAELRAYRVHIVV